MFDFFFICVVLFIIFTNVIKKTGTPQSRKSNSSRPDTTPERHSYQDQFRTNGQENGAFQNAKQYYAGQDIEFGKRGRASTGQVARALKKAKQNREIQSLHVSTAKDRNKSRRSDWGAKSRDIIDGKFIAALMGVIAIIYILSSQ